MACLPWRWSGKLYVIDSEKLPKIKTANNAFVEGHFNLEIKMLFYRSTFISIEYLTKYMSVWKLAPYELQIEAKVVSLTQRALSPPVAGRAAAWCGPCLLPRERRWLRTIARYLWSRWDPPGPPAVLSRLMSRLLPQNKQILCVCFQIEYWLCGYIYWSRYLLYRYR